MKRRGWRIIINAGIIENVCKNGYIVRHLVIEVENLFEPNVGMLYKVCVEEASKY